MFYSVHSMFHSQHTEGHLEQNLPHPATSCHIRIQDVNQMSEFERFRQNPIKVTGQSGACLAFDLKKSWLSFPVNAAGRSSFWCNVLGNAQGQSKEPRQVCDAGQTERCRFEDRHLPTSGLIHGTNGTNGTRCKFLAHVSPMPMIRPLHHCSRQNHKLLSKWSNWN